MLSGFPTGRDSSNNFPTSNQFAISPDGKTIFVADSRTDGSGGILEYYDTLGGGAYAFIGSLQAGTGADSGLRGLVADFSNPSAPVLYATTTAGNANRIVKITGGTTDGSTPTFTITTVATAPANEAFRGVALAPTAPGATASTTTLAVTNSPATYGTGVTLTATVTTGATGWVSFRQNGVEIGAAPIISGTATLATAGNLGAGAYTNIVAVYTGNATYAASSSAAQSATVNKASTTTTLTESANPVAVGVVDKLTAVVAAPAGTAPTGTVTFWDGAVGTGTNLGTATVSQVIVNVAGSPVIEFVATLNATFSTVATHNLSAVYSGDNNFTTSTGTSSLVVVNATTTTVTSNNSDPTASPSSTVTYTATVTSVGGTPTGSVEFFDGLLPFLYDPITSATEIGTTVTITAANPVPFTNGQTVGVTNMSVAGYDGDFVISNVSGDTFQYTAGASGLANGSNGMAGLAAVLNGSGVATATINTALVQAAAGAADVLTPGLHSISAVYVPDSAGANTYFTSTGVNEQAVQGQAFEAGDQFVYRVGDGVTPLNPPAPPSSVSGSIGSAIFVDEYHTAFVASATESGNTVTVTTSGPDYFQANQQVIVSGIAVAGYNGTFTILSASGNTFTYTDSTSGLGAAGSGGTADSLVQSIALPTADGTGSQSTIHAVVGNGQQSATGQMSLSGDGQFLFVAGYDNNPLNVTTAAPIPTASGSGSTSRSIARIKYDGTITDVAMTASNSGSSFGNFNAVYSPDGNQFYVAGNGGVVYYSSFSPSSGLVTPMKTMSSPTGATTALEGAGGNLIVVGPPGFGNDGPQVYSGFPTTAASVSNLPGFSDAAATAGGQASTFYIDAYFTHLNGTGRRPASTRSTCRTTARASRTGRSPSGRRTSGASRARPSRGTTVTITATAPLAFVNGQTVTIAGVGVAGYNGTFTITGVSGNTFTYTAASGLANSSGGTATQWQVVDHVTAGTNNSATSFYYFNGSTDKSGNVTLGVTYGNGGNSDTGPGDLYSITDANGWGAPIGTGGTHSDVVNTLAATGSTSNEVFRGVAATPLPAVAGVVTNGTTDAFTIVSATESGTTVTITTQAPVDFAVGQQVLITGVGVTGYNGTFTITAVGGNTFTYTAGSSSLAVSLGGQADAVNWTISTATEATNTVTITTSAPTGLYTGEVVAITGVGVAGYNGDFTITVTSSTTFTYTDGTAGLANSSGGTATAALAGAQRSAVTSVVYKFNQAVTLGANAFTVGVHAGQTGTVPTVNYSSPDGGFTWIVTYSGAGVTANHSIADGVYDILLNPTAVTYNASGATLTQNNRGTDTFYRLYGDLQGSKSVSLFDKGKFNLAFGTSPGAANYQIAFVDDGNFSIDAFDKAKFNLNFGKSFSGFTPTI